MEKAKYSINDIQEILGYGKSIPVWQKLNLTVEEACAYTGIGENKLREYIKKNENKLVIRVGKKILVKRRILEQLLTEETEL